MRVLKVRIISLPYIVQVVYVLCLSRQRYQVSVHRTIGWFVIHGYFVFSFTGTVKLRN